MNFCNTYSILLLLPLFNTPVLSHNIKTSGDVGVTFHIEPDHSPRAKETSQAWFVLTRQGGKIIPLSECDCQLNIYDSQKQLVKTPSLISLSPEKYQNIPGANVVFDEPGIYSLEIQGKPRNNSDFKTFSVAYSVTVSPSNIKEIEKNNLNKKDAIATEVSETIITSSNNSSFPIVPSLLILGGISAISGFWWLKKK